MIASGAGAAARRSRHLVGRERLDDGARDRRDLEPRERIGPDVVLGHDPVTEHAERPGPGGDGGGLAAAFDEVGQPGAADAQVDVGQGQVAIVGAGEGAVGVEPLEVELDRPLRQDLRAAGGDEGRDDRVEAVAARVAAASTRSQVNIAIRRIR